ncbi:probable inactive serine/threonine-protein kinase bub1 [Ananas comosus]|uniref:Probable inactive serine/threonine-protein kinase bub1 n=1 Tax=Ananas comosus TaxID=4615 RepID=A0A6P5H2D4_ANACO|nr:probable inactive serine/threonine-protein kinase bub1 [Ananas comosus]
MATDPHKELFSSLVADIKTYSGSDPLRPWLRGIRRLKEALPSRSLKEKLPRFLQKCAQAFESDRRYRDDPRYLRVWIELMDYVDDAKVLLKKMEKNQIGTKRAIFYLASALYYEKHKKFERAEKIYRQGVENLAEPVGELQKSYEQFLHRMELCKKRKAKLQEVMHKKGKLNLKGSRGEGTLNNSLPNADAEHLKKVVEKPTLVGGFIGPIEDGSKDLISLENIPLENSGNICDDWLVSNPRHCSEKDLESTIPKVRSQNKRNPNIDKEKLSRFNSDDTVVVKFVDSAIVGKSEAEDACHHGLVDPTINMREAMSAINNMFREPLELDPSISRRSQRNRAKLNRPTSGFEIFVDEDGPNPIRENPKYSQSEAKHEKSQPFSTNSSMKQTKIELQKPFVGIFKMLADDEEEENSENDDEGIGSYLQGCEKPKGLKGDIANDVTMINYGLNEDTVVHRFVGSAVFGEPKVENACHHGLVDPTVNLKEAMDEINSMFGKPLNFFKGEKPRGKQSNKRMELKPASSEFSIFVDEDLGENINEKRQGKQSNKRIDLKPASSVFSILSDKDSRENSNGQAFTNTSNKFGGEVDLFEPTIFTREAMAEINDLFGKPLDF